MHGPGTSRIDTVLANTAGSERVQGIWYDWELSRTFDHVAIAVAIRGGTYHHTGNRLVTPQKFDFNTLEKLDATYKEQLWEYTWALYEADFDEAIQQGNIDKARPTMEPCCR